MKTVSSRQLVVLVSALVLCGLSAAASAQNTSNKRKARVIRIDTIKVEGKIQKPEAFYILQRSQLNFEGLEPKKSFLPLIIKSVDKEPF